MIAAAFSVAEGSAAGFFSSPFVSIQVHPYWRRIMNFDTVIHSGIVLTVNPEFDIIYNGIICIKDGIIVRVEQHNPCEKLPEAAEMIDAGGGIVMPGLINTHTHLPMSLFRGLADDLPLQTWLNDHIFPAEASHINEESVHWGTLLSCAEMLLSGTTTCCDGYFLEDKVAKAVQTTGMRAVLGQGIVDFPAPGVPDPAENVDHARSFVDQWHGFSDRITPSVFCHSPYTCSEDTLKRAKAAASEKGILFQIHTAETRGEREQFETEHGISPVGWLDRLGILDANTLLAHAVWVDQKDMALIVKRGAKVSHNPESNMKLASGVAPVPEMLRTGITVGLGTDGCASNNNLDLFQEMDTTAKLHKVIRSDPTVMDATTVIRMATIEGAKAIGLEKKIGSIEIGKKADIIILDMQQPHLKPMYHPESHVVYAASGADVRDVIVGGDAVVKERKLCLMDIDEILENVNVLSHFIKKG